MKKILFATAAAALAMTGTAATAETAQERGEARLAKMLEGREAGEPQSCINTFRSNELRVIEKVGVVYDSGKTIYVARAHNPESLGNWDVPVFKRWGSQLCKQDQIHTIDRSSGFFSGVVLLDDFVPYTRVAEEG